MAASFIEERFPLSVSFGASGGPEWRTEVVTLASGAEARNARWARARRRYDAGTGVRSLADLAAVAAFFERMGGRLTGFRFRDPFDNTSAPPGAEVSPLDREIGEGDGTRTAFRLVRAAGAGHPREITKPVAGTVRIAVGGEEQAEGAGFSLDATTGLVTLAAPPGPGVPVTAGFRFDVPVRFDTDRLDMSLTHFEAGRVPTIPLIEIDPAT
uniref:phage distal tail protein, Rcc01695 family n=1 Tax=Stappia sp. TaxID=1870903 RepID=UPI003BAC8B1E